MSNKKDPAVLFFPANWLTSTAEMDADCTGWYLNLILHNYDKGDLPNDIENLAKLANVKFSDFNRFKQVFEQVLNKKFDLLENGRFNTKFNYFTNYCLNEKGSHWNWKGGITPKLKAIRSSSKMILWRKKVYLRDNYTCRLCNKKGGKLNAHHIKYFSTHPHLRFDINNGITLCKECHINLHKAERNG